MAQVSKLFRKMQYHAAFSPNRQFYLDQFESNRIMGNCYRSGWLQRLAGTIDSLAAKRLDAAEFVVEGSVFRAEYFV